MARTCYYELLGVERTATDSDLKKAYRKQALVWHPATFSELLYIFSIDKNYDNVEEATQIFAQIKEAYETLSDPQERTWYDNHREQILRGDDFMATPGAGGGQGDYSANVSFTSTDSLMKYFSVSSFRGFDGSPGGFYAVYRSIFEKLRDEEIQVFDPDTEEHIDVIYNLDFGDSHTHFDEDALYASAQGRSKHRSRREGTGTTLRDFYNFWTTFSTRKSFGWFDKYRLADAENRQIRRLMEKENKNMREKAKREFTETVQNLAAWVKKRDPRYKQFVEEQQRLQAEREKDRKRRVTEQRAAIIEGASTYVRQAWEEVDYSNHLEEYISDFSEGPEGSESDSASGSKGQKGESEQDALSCRDASDQELDPESELVCVTCDKVFKTAAQKANHEKSKKHQKAVREIRREMLREERHMAKMMARGEIPAHPNPSSGAVDASEDDEAFSTPLESVSDAGAKPESDADADVDADTDADAVNEDDDVLAQMIRNLSMAQAKGSKKNKSKSKRRQNASKALSATGDELDTSCDPAEAVDSLSQSADTTGDQEEGAETVDESRDTPPQRLSKKELRKERQKKKEQKELLCNVCNKQFTSRNQLFNHIKDTGHALASNLPKHLVDQILQERSAKGKKGKGGGKH